MSRTHNVALVGEGHALEPVREADLDPPPSTKRFTAAGLRAALAVATQAVDDEPTLMVSAEENRRLLEAAFGGQATRPLLEPDLERALAAAFRASGTRATATAGRGDRLDRTELAIGYLWAMMAALVTFTIYVATNAG